MIVVQKITYTRLCSLLDDEGNRCTSHHDQANHCECYRTHTTGGRKKDTLFVIHCNSLSNYICILNTHFTVITNSDFYCRIK